MRTPPGVSAATYATALREFERVVGKANVYTSDEDLDLYRDAYSLVWDEPDERIASGAVAPADVGQVQAVVRVANTYKIPIYPVSTGRNLGYGGSAPNYSGSVVLDLKRMNKIVEFSEEQRYVIVEPGVSFFDLWRELRARNSRLQFSQPAPGWGSPMGNALDYGRGGPAGDNYRNSCGMEVVLGNGELIRTGMGALPNAKTWATYPNGVGPNLNGIFCQSNYGVVTKMGFNLFPWPETIRRLAVTTASYDDLDRMVEICNALQAMGIGDGSGVGSPLGQIQKPEVLAAFAKPGGNSAAVMNQLGRDNNVPVWRMGLNFSGPDRVTEAQLEVARERLSAIPGVQLAAAGNVVHAPEDIEKLTDDQQAAFGKPRLVNFWSDTAQYAWDGHLWFSPLLPQTGAELRQAHQVFSDVCRNMDIYWGVPPALLYNTHALGAQATAYCIVKNMRVSKTDKAYNRRTRDAVARLIRVGADHGWSEYRTAPALQEAVMDTFSFNNHSLMRACETIKDALDPNGILSAGRYGIWPRRLRKARA